MGYEEWLEFPAKEYPRDPPYMEQAECSLCHSIVPKDEIRNGLCEICRLVLEKVKDER